ncbi:hypothetical protein CRM22_001150 [Opisthorchis felineus]|uniref:Uncharacterized protein n=1 Tax=Opisthorchis felineus TaxID=147828 RepID=A0A4S2MHX5_OPIFE|nr:hypothetical protein CRM22_001150 [Opisthorchis felineus]
MAQFSRHRYIFLWCGILCCVAFTNSNLQTTKRMHGFRPPRGRIYSAYRLDSKTGFIRPVAAVVPHPAKKGKEAEKIVAYPENEFTMFEAVPHSLDQFIRSYGHGLLDISWNINEVPPVVHVHMLWVEETNRPISLPCWAPAEPKTIGFFETTFRGHKRTWLIGQGNTLSLSLASAFGYKTDPSSGALLLSPFLGMQATHNVFTCLLSRESSSEEKARPRVSFTQTHMLYIQTDEERLQSATDSRLEVELELAAFAPESLSPACHVYGNEWGPVCREAPWQQIRTIDVHSNNSGYRYFYNEHLNFDGKNQLADQTKNIIKDFCRIHLCSAEISNKTVILQEKSISMPEFVHFAGGTLKLKDGSLQKVETNWEPPTSNWTRDTYRLPGNAVVRMVTRMVFTNGFLDCNIIKYLFEPDIGDLQQTAHHMALDEAPFNPLANMLRHQELTWVSEQDTPDAVKYRPTFCSDKKESAIDYETEEVPIYNASAGYTIIFSMPYDNAETMSVHIGDMGGGTECDVTVGCDQSTCSVAVQQDSARRQIRANAIPKKGLYSTPTSFKSPEDRLIVVLVVEPMDTRWQQTFQHVTLYRNGLRVAEGAIAVFDPSKFVICSGLITTELTLGSWVKILNWPETELAGPSKARAERAYEHLLRPCRESFTGVPYSSSGQLRRLTLHPNNEKHIHFALTGVLCSSPCVPSRDGGELINFECITTSESEPCMRHYFVSIKRETYEVAQNASNWQYAAFAIQFCGASIERILEDSPYSILNRETHSCNISGKVRSLMDWVHCDRDKSLTDFQGNLIGPNECRLISADKRAPVGTSKLKLLPVVKKCEPKASDPALFPNYIRPARHKVRRLTYNDRSCPIGYRKAKSLDSYTCIPCPPDSFADLETELTSCQGCPLARPSTYSAEAASSAQCSNDQLNKLRGLFFRYDMSNLSEDEWDRSFNLSAQLWWNQNHTSITNLDHLKPEEKYLEQQRQAVALFQAMTQLTFSKGEVFLMIMVSASLSVFGGVNFLLLLAATSRPTKCPGADFYGPEASLRERIGMAIYCALARLAIMMATIFRRIKLRTMRGLISARRSIRDSRMSTATSTLSRKFSNLIKSRYEGYKLPPLTEGQKKLVHLLTRTTIDRIVEAAERDLTATRERRRLISEQYQQRRHDAGEVEAEAHEAELAAEAAKREAEKAARVVLDTKEGRAKTSAISKAEEAKKLADDLEARATDLRALAIKRLQALKEFGMERHLMEEERQAAHWLSESDWRAVEHAAAELRAYMKLPRFHTPEYFLLLPGMYDQAEARSTIYPAPERDQQMESRSSI